MKSLARESQCLKPFALALGLTMCVIATSCGQSTGTVRGSVTHDGKPLTGGFVLFFLDDGTSIGGEILGDGNYAIEGVPLGNAIVVVKPATEGDQSARHMSIKNEKGKAPETPPPAKFPDKYSDMATSPLVCRVVAGDNRFDIDLK